MRRGNGFSHDLAERNPKCPNRAFCCYRLLCDVITFIFSSILLKLPVIFNKLMKIILFQLNIIISPVAVIFCVFPANKGNKIPNPAPSPS